MGSKFFCTENYISDYHKKFGALAVIFVPIWLHKCLPGERSLKSDTKKPALHLLLDNFWAHFYFAYLWLQYESPLDIKYFPLF